MRARVAATLATGEVVHGTLERETATTAWIACDDGRLAWAYRADVVPCLRVA